MKTKKNKINIQFIKRITALIAVFALLCSSSLANIAASTTTPATESTATSTAAASATTPASVSNARAPLNYTETRGVVHLTLATMINRIKTDNDDYQVSQKRVDIYQRKHAAALYDKYLAENKDAPAAVHSAQRVAYEKQLHTDWRNSELELERYQNDLQDKFDRIRSSLKKQYTDILDMEKGLSTYQDEMTKLNGNIEQLSAQIRVGVAKESDMDVYKAQKLRLDADIAARLRDIELAKYNLKLDLKIDQSKEISLTYFDEKFIRFNDTRMERQIKTAVDKCFGVTSNIKKLDILKEERIIMLQFDYQGAMITGLQNNEIAIKEAEYAIISARKTEESGLWSDYYSLLNQEDQIEVERANVKIAENDYNVVAAKLNQGLVTPLDEQNSRIALENAKSTLQTAINNYVRMYEDLELRLKN